MANIKLSSKTSTTADVTATFYAPNFNPRASHTERTRRWTVRLVRPGDSWGLNNKLILEEGKEPRIEFYDGGVGPTPPSAEKSDRATYGVLASYYNISTLFADAIRLATQGLNLHGGVPSWTVDQDLMRQVFMFLDIRRDYWQPKAVKKPRARNTTRKAVKS